MLYDSIQQIEHPFVSKYRLTISLINQIFQNAMQAANPAQSSIKINFGEKHAPESPVDLHLILDFFSAQQQTLRSQLSTQYKTQLPPTSFAFEFVVESGSAKETAQRLTKVVKQEENNQSGKHSSSFHHYENRVLCLLQAPEYAELIQSKEEYFAELKTEAANENHAISLRIVSHNDLKVIAEKSKEYGRLAWLENTQLQFSFVKTDLISKFLTILFEQIIGVDTFSSILRSFSKLNFQLNFAGAEYLREFPKIKTGGFLAAQSHKKTELVSIFQEAGVQKAKFYGFNPTIFLRGDLLVTGLQHHLQFAFK